jgi:putative transposase
MALLRLQSLREPRVNQISTSVYFYSPKINRQIWCESNLEWDTAIILDQDPMVIEYIEQGIELSWSKSNWIPDFVALIESNGEYRILIIEVKYIQELVSKRDEFLQKYSETQQWIKANFEILAKQITKLPISQIDFIIVTDIVLQQSFRVKNCRKLIQAVIEDKIDYQIHHKVLEIMDGIAQIPLDMLIRSIKALFKQSDSMNDIIISTLYAMMYRQEIWIDFEALLLPNTLIHSNFPNHQSAELWLKRYNWADQYEIQTPLIKHQDLYFIAKTPERSIELWKIANDRLETIQNYLDRSIEELKTGTYSYRNKKLSWAAVYNWIRKYRAAKGDIRALLPQFSNCGQNQDQLSPIAEELWEYGKQKYLQLEKKKIQQSYNLMESYAYAQNKGQDCMSYSAFYRRIRKLSALEVAQKRDGEKSAEKAFTLSESEFPHGEFPLQSVQIDHTPIDIMIVDDENRMVTERPYLTVAFDCYSRCVLGYYISYNDPSRLSIAMTLLNCIQEKTESLNLIQTQFPDLDKDILLKIQSSKWPNVYGLPYTLHMDNGSDFRSHDVLLFGARYKVHLHYRAVTKPQHGAFIERFLGTVNSQIHGIPGTTFSNIAEKKEYPSEKKATYTIKELEARILMVFLHYHEEQHSHLRMTPLKKWHDAFAQNRGEMAVTHNLNRVDPEFFHLDVLPSEMRTVQKQGVQIFTLNYSDARIQKWIGAKNLQDLNIAQEFLIRYDPRDIRKIYFYDPGEKGYILLKCSDNFIQTHYHHQSLPLWQWNAIKQKYNSEYKNSESDYQNKKRAYVQVQQSMDEETASRTKSARIKRARQLSNDADQKDFIFNAGLSPEEQEVLNNFDASLFKIDYDENTKYIHIPLEQQNPFSGIEYIEDEKELEKKKRSQTFNE